MESGTMDGTTLAVLASTLTGLATLFITKGIDSWLKVKADKRIDDVRKEAHEEGTLRFIIGRQDAQIEQLVKELNEMRKQHANCEKQHEALRVRLELLETKVRFQVEHQRLDLPTPVNHTEPTPPPEHH